MAHSLGLNRFLRHLDFFVNPILGYFPGRRLDAALNVADLRAAAEKRMHRNCFGYLDSGSDDEVTLRRNKDAYTEYELHFDVLSGAQYLPNRQGQGPHLFDCLMRFCVTGLAPPLEMGVELFGKKLDLPFFACPTAGNRMFHTEGERAVAAAAAHYGSLYCLSTLATTSIADVAETLPSGHPKLFQLYVWRDRELLRDVLAQSREAGYDALALTVDFTWYGNRERDFRNGFTIPPEYTTRQVWEAIKRPSWTWDFLSNEPYTYALLNNDVPAESLAKFVNEQINPEFSWRDAEWLLGEWNGPVALKGVCRPDTAKRALETGFKTIWISNHGGRQLDSPLVAVVLLERNEMSPFFFGFTLTSTPPTGSPATIDVLPSIRDAVGPDAEIILDGGVQRGTDIAKALALGADAVGVGKPYLYGLGAGGTAGVKKTFEILRLELERAMGLLGIGSVSALKRDGRDFVRRRPASSRDGQGARYADSGII